MSHTNTGRPASNPRTRGSAAAYAGCIGLPEPSGRLLLRDGGLDRFCGLFNRRADEWLSHRSIECRNFVRAERAARGV